jgi:protein-S-isoprenylcysteine O-methyltransferase Ste14
MDGARDGEALVRQVPVVYLIALVFAALGVWTGDRSVFTLVTILMVIGTLQLVRSLRDEKALRRAVPESLE